MKRIILFDIEKNAIIKKYNDIIIPRISELISLYCYNKTNLNEVSHKNYMATEVKHVLKAEEAKEGFFINDQIGCDHILIFVKEIADVPPPEEQPKN